MVLGRRELSAIVLAIVAILFYLVLLSTTPSGAQTSGSQTILTGVTLNQVTTQTINPTPSNQGGVTAIARPPRRPPRERTIINVPGRPLPPSGGLPVYGIVASSVLMGAGLLALGLVIRRGTRR